MVASIPGGEKHGIAVVRGELPVCDEQQLGPRETIAALEPECAEVEELVGRMRGTLRHNIRVDRPK